MSVLEVSVRMKVRQGQLDAFKRQAHRCVDETREKDTGTLRYDWFLSSDGSECESREAYADARAVIAHRVENVQEATNELFTHFADDPVVSVYGDAPPELVAFATARMGDTVKWFTLFTGIDS